MAKRVDVDAALFRAAAECQSTEETRYYLNGVFVQPHPVSGVVLTATDGHRLICIHDETGKADAPLIIGIERKALAAQSQAKLPTPGPLRLTVDEDGHAIVGTYRSISSAIVDGSYPDYARILKPIVERAKKEERGAASYKPEYIIAFAKIAGMLSPEGMKGGSMKIITFADGEPSLVRFSNRDNAFGILMPMRADNSNHMPAFMQPLIEPPAPAAPPVEAEKPTAPAKAVPSKKKPAARKKLAARKPAKPAKKKAKTSAKRRAA